MRSTVREPVDVLFSRVIPLLGTAEKDYLQEGAITLHSTETLGVIKLIFCS